MLLSLSIKNYALIESLETDFSNQFSVITGETGAGKSILLGALGLVLGNRADLTSLKDKEQKCVIEAVFTIENYNLKSFFEENDFDYETETIIRREILPSGKSRAFINDSPVNLQQLQDLSDCLIDIHSQHQTLELSNQDFKTLFETYYKNAEIVAYDTNRNFDYKRECLPMYFKIKNEWILLFTQKGELRFSHIQNGKLDDETVGQIDFQGFPAKLSDKKLIVLKETKENNYSAYSYSVSEKINDDFLNQSIGIELKEKKLDYSTQNFVEMLSRKKEEYYFTGSYFDLPDWVTPNFMNTGFFKLNYKGEDIFFKDKVLKHYNKTPQNNLFLYELPKKFRTKTKVAFLDYNLNIGGVMNNETSEVEPLNKNAGLYIVKPKKK